jgi:hypothetical protein
MMRQIVGLAVLLTLANPTEGLAETCLQKISPIVASEFLQTDDGLLVGSKEGLFRLKADSLIEITADRPIGSVFGFHQAADALLIKASNGLFRRDGDHLVEIKADRPLESTSRLKFAGSFVGTDSGFLTDPGAVFRRVGNKLVEIKHINNRPIENVSAMYQAGDDLMIVTKSGGWPGPDASSLYRLSGDRLVDVQIGTGLSNLMGFSFLELNGSLLIGSAEGMFRLHNGEVVRLTERPMYWLRKMQLANGAALIATNSGTYRWRDNELTEIKDDGGRRVNASAVAEAGGKVVVGAEKGVFWLLGDELVEVKAASAVSGIAGLYPAGDQLIVISQTQIGVGYWRVFRLRYNKLVELQPDRPLFKFSDSSSPSFFQARVGLFLYAEDGPARGVIFRINNDKLTVVEADRPFGNVDAFYQMDDTLLVIARDAWAMGMDSIHGGLFRLRDNALREIKGENALTVVSVSRLVQDLLLIASTDGLFRYSRGCMQ